jgi:hypothetical protein
VVHSQHHIDNGGNESTPKACEETADDKDDAEDETHIDPYGTDHLPVDGCRPGNLTHFRLIHNEPEHNGHNGADQQEEEVIDREGQTEDGNGALKKPGHGHGPVFRTPHHLDQVAKDQSKGEGEQEEHDVLSLIEPGKDTALNDKTDEGYAQGRQKDGHPVTRHAPAEYLGNGVGHESPDHVKGPVGDVGDS